MGGITTDAPFHSFRIVYLHRSSPAAPAAGSCSNAAAGNFCGNSGREARLDYRAVDSVTLHPHSIAAAELWYYSSSTEAAGTELKFVWKKKIKKDLTSRITWDIKGVLTRKTKG
jgi:hypothetical protein